MASKHDIMDSMSHCNHGDDQNNRPGASNAVKTGTDPNLLVCDNSKSKNLPIASGGVELGKRQLLVDPDYAVVTHHSMRQRALDPDYEEITATQNKRQRILEEDAKEATKRKIGRIIQTQFSTEILNKQTEVAIIDQRLNQARSMIDRLRACIVANFYGTASQQGISQGKHFPSEIPSIHPAVKKHLGKAPVGAAQKIAPQNDLHEKKSSTGETTLITDNAKPMTAAIVKQEPESSSSSVVDMENKSTKVGSSASSSRPLESMETKRGSRFRIKKKIIVGNVSKFIPVERRDDNDQASHKWMIYVRGPQDEPKINDFVKKVWFFLHPSYRPNDLVEISQPPFHLTRRGWGEFPVRIQLHFWDSRNKRVDIIHQLMLDKTCTGLQTLGSETVVEIELEKEEVEETSSNSVSLPVTNQKKKEKTRSIKNSPRKRVTSEEKDNSELTPEIKQEPLSDGENAEVVNEENTHVNIKHDKHSTKHSKVKIEQISPEVENTNKRKLESLNNGDTEYQIHDSVDCDHKPNISNTVTPDVNSDIQNRTSSKGGKHSHRKKMKLKDKINKSVDSSRISLSVKDSSASSISEKNGSSPLKTSVTPLTVQNPVCTGLCSNYNGVTFSVNSQGKNVVQGKEMANKSSPKVSVLNKASTSQTSQMYIKSTDTKGNVVLQLIGERSPCRNVDGSSVIKTGQVSLLDRKKMICTAGQKPSNYAVILGSGTSTFASPVCTSSANPLRLTLTTSAQNSSSCGRISDSVLKSGVISSHGSVGPVSGVNSSQSSGASVSCVTSSHIGGGPVSVVKSSNTGGAPVSGGNSGHISGSTVSVVNSSNSSGAPVSVVNSSHTSAPAVQSVRLVVTPQGLKMIPVTTDDKGGNCSAIPTSQNKTDLRNKSNQKSPASVKSSLLPSGLQPSGALLKEKGNTDNKNSAALGTHQLMLANIGDQTFVLKVVPNQIPTNPAVTQNNPKLGENSPLTNSVVTNLPATQFINNKITSSSGSLVDNKNMLVISSPMCNKISATHKNLTLNISNTSSSHPVGTSAKSTNRDQSYIQSLLKMPFNTEEKKMLVLRKDKEREKEVREEIPELTLNNYTDMLSVVRAAVRHHPVVKEPTDQVTHPYCARSTEQWLRWNIGKRRASEWQRASTVRRYIAKHLEDGHNFKGEQLWTTKQIMIWCRLHAYSPHYLEQFSTPQSGYSKGERIPDGVSPNSDDAALNTKPSSLSEPGPLIARLSSMMDSLDDDEEASSSEEEIEILSIDQPKVKMKQEVKATISHSDPLYLPTSDSAVFVQEINQKIGVNFQPTEIEDGVFGSASQDVIFGVMKIFMEDILREAFQAKSKKDKMPETISAVDVFEGLNTLRTADFLTNRYMGVKEDKNITDTS